MSINQFLKKLVAPTDDATKQQSTEAEFTINKTIASYTDVVRRLQEVRRELLRDQIAIKWSTVDFYYRKHFDETADRHCPLCGHHAPGTEFDRLRSHCIFGGGDLLRYVCPACNLTYGPDKMLDLTPAELTEEYERHYRAYEEGDSTESELRAFLALNPDKKGVYLNYGAGGWSSSVQQLRAQGWNVYAYEPHSSAMHSGQHDWLITSYSQLRTMRFAGIFSNNVLEHFRHPVQELERMTDLLAPGAHMAHATPCFEYLYEYTRFHLFFFTGEAKNLLIEKANLQLVDEVVDGHFMCRVMKPITVNVCHD